MRKKKTAFGIEFSSVIDLYYRKSYLIVYSSILEKKQEMSVQYVNHLRGDSPIEGQFSDADEEEDK